MKNISMILGLNEIYKKYDTFILDQWGVMHDGEAGYSSAMDCVKKLYQDNKKLIIISNSSKRKKTTAARLPDLGFDPSHFKEIVTSGEMIWQSLYYENYLQTKNIGKKCFHIYDNSKEDGKKYLDGLEKFDFVDKIEKANFILGCTPFVNQKIIDYIPLLDIAKNNNIPFICANPDFETVENNSKKLVFCMGTIAELYKNIGGKIFILGKPNIEIYYKAMNNYKNIDKSKILAIGDSLHHDIKGANNFGIDSLLITSTGIHQEYFDKKNPKWDIDTNFLKKFNIRPTYLCPTFCF